MKRKNGGSMNIKLSLLLLSAIVLGTTYSAQAADLDKTNQSSESSALDKRKRDQFEDSASDSDDNDSDDESCAQPSKKRARVEHSSSSSTEKMDESSDEQMELKEESAM